MGDISCLQKPWVPVTQEGVGQVQLWLFPALVPGQPTRANRPPGISLEDTREASEARAPQGSIGVLFFKDPLGLGQVGGDTCTCPYQGSLFGDGSPKAKDPHPLEA